MSRASEKVTVPDSERGGWFTSSFSGGGNDQCVECCLTGGSGVLVRDSKNRDLAPFRFASGVWAAFVCGVKSGEFQVPG